MRVADVHAHIFPDALAVKAARSIGDFYDIESENLASVGRLLEAEREAGICTTLVCNSAVSAHQAPSINAFVGETVTQHPEFLGLGSVFPGMEDWQGELERVKQLGLRGIKIHSDFQRVDIDDPAALEMYRACARMGLLVMFHMGDNRYDHSAPRRLLNLKRYVPDLTVIAAHFGGYRRWQESLEMPMPEGVWYDTSSSLMFLQPDLTKRLLDKLGTHRILFGSDFPMWTPETELKRFLAAPLGLTEAERDAILYGNFARLFGLEDRQ